MISSIEIDLTTAAADRFEWINLDNLDSISIEAKMLVGADFQTGVITVMQANCINGGVFSTGVTMTAPGFFELTSTDWIQAKWLTFQATTAASGPARVHLVINTKRIEFKL